MMEQIPNRGTTRDHGGRAPFLSKQYSSTWVLPSGVRFSNTLPNFHPLVLISDIGLLEIHKRGLRSLVHWPSTVPPWPCASPCHATTTAAMCRHRPRRKERSAGSLDLSHLTAHRTCLLIRDDSMVAVSRSPRANSSAGGVPYNGRRRLCLACAFPTAGVTQE